MAEGGDKQRLDGIYSKGYGYIPKLVMTDTDLSAEAKAIYSYLCSYAGNKNTAYPSVSLMRTHLNMSENRFYKHRKQLIEKGYIKIDRMQRKDGTWENNIYTLVKEPYRQFEGMDNRGMENEGTNKNSSNNNSLTNNSNNKDNNIKFGNSTDENKKRVNNNIESNDSTTLWLHDKNQLRKLLLDERMVEIISYYASVYKEVNDDWHPRISEEQLEQVENNLGDIDAEFSLTLLDKWEELINEYWESENVGDGNIVRFASGDVHQGILAGMLK